MVMTLRERIGEWYARVRALVILYERRAALLGLIVGFVFDLLFFQRVDSFFENVVIILQLALGIAAVVLAHVATAPYRIAPYVRKIVPFLPFLMGLLPNTTFENKRKN